MKFTSVKNQSVTKLTGFIVLLVLLQGLVIGWGAYHDTGPSVMSTTDDQQSIESVAQALLIPEGIPQSEIKASYLNWEKDFSPEGESPGKNESDTTGEPVRYVVKRGDTLSQIWKKLGGSIQQANLAAKAFKKQGVSLTSLHVGEELLVHRNAQGDISRLRKDLQEGKVLSLELRDSTYDAQILSPDVVTTQRTVSGTIERSLATSCLKEGVPYEVIDEFIDLFSGRVEFSRDTQPGDTFSIIYDERNIANGRTLSAGTIHAASFMNRGELMVAIRYEDKNGEAHYYDQEGKPIGNHFLRYPLRFTRISSVFTKARFHPVQKRWKPHNGVDFAAPTGTPVRSVSDGVILKAGYYGGNGNMVKIKYSDKYAAAYLHLSRISKGVRAGTRVKRGQVIGAVGSTGLATGPHLHYSFYVYSKYVDPMKIKLPRVPEQYTPIPGRILKTMLRKLKHQHKQAQLASNNFSQNSNASS